MADLLMGFEELSKELAQIAKDAGPEKRKRALEAGAKIVVEKARASVPVRTGLLKREGIAAESPKDDAVEIGWTQSGFYGRFLEHGTSKMRARPHLQPAYEREQNRITQTMLRELKLT